MYAYLSLQLSNQQSLQDLSRLVTVSDILESLGGILSAYVEQDFLSSAAI